MSRFGASVDKSVSLFRPEPEQTKVWKLKPSGVGRASPWRRGLVKEEEPAAERAESGEKEEEPAAERAESGEKRRSLQRRGRSQVRKRRSLQQRGRSQVKEEEPAAERAESGEKEEEPAARGRSQVRKRRSLPRRGRSQVRRRSLQRGRRGLGSQVKLCVEESSAMTPSDELHSTDSASFPSLTDDDITTDDITTDDITSTTVGGVSPEPSLQRDGEGRSLSQARPQLPKPLPHLQKPLPCPQKLLLQCLYPSSLRSRSSSSAAVAPSSAAVAPPSAAVAPPSSSSSSAQQGAGLQEQGAGLQEVYLVKWITWKGQRTPIVTQSQNGPCPLLAVMNTLFLRWKAKLPAQTEVVTIEDLMTHLGECVLSVTPREKSKGEELNFQQNMNDAMAVLPKLCTGLDVNVHFTGVSDFEYTPECIVFDLLDIPLYHGWLLDPQSPEAVAAVGRLSYNQLVEKIIDCKQSSDSSRVSEGLVAEQFLESTASQLTYHGLCELTSRVREGEISVFFRNNHFSTIVKNQGHLYLLVTDQGFQSEERLVFESLHNVEGDGNFCDSDFRLVQKIQDYNRSTEAQIDQDYLVAVSLQQQQTGESLSDAELARRLQQEEYQQQSSAQASTQPARAQPSQSSRRREKEEKDCVIL
ncbi:hypothetical protein WMY93_019148 [Mugilogobius chulae]|uniref:Ubiquitin carboxyl-terminal hydrolase n=1 Tax=Mugilogobius chulae TaxID=88201 RepID=A0AAW0NI98_9GOBI